MNMFFANWGKTVPHWGYFLQLNQLKNTTLSGFFKWPNQKDEINYCMESVIEKIDPAAVAGNQRQFTFGYLNTQ